MSDYEYYGSDGEIIDEDLVGNPRNDLAFVSLILSCLSLFYVVTKLSGPTAILFGLLGVSVSLRALRYNKKSRLARIALIAGGVGTLIGFLLFVSCISCAACTIRNIK